MHYIKSAREARVLLERLADAEQPRRDQHRERQRHDDRGTHLADERIKKVVGPVVHVGRARERRLREMVQGVDVAVQEGTDVAIEQAALEAEPRMHATVHEKKVHTSELRCNRERQYEPQDEVQCFSDLGVKKDNIFAGEFKDVGNSVFRGGDCYLGMMRTNFNNFAQLYSESLAD